MQAILNRYYNTAPKSTIDIFFALWQRDRFIKEPL